MKFREYILAAALAALVFLPVAASAAIYKYVDENGTINFTDSLYKVPDKYRESAVEVKSEVQVEESGGGMEKQVKKWIGRTETSWQDFVVNDESGAAKGINVRAMLIQALFESRLIYWFAGELVFSMVMLVLLLVYMNWPTARGRKIAMAAICAGWVLSSFVIVTFFTLPAARNFLATSRGYVSEMMTGAPLDDESRKVLDTLDADLVDYQEGLH